MKNKAREESESVERKRKGKRKKGIEERERDGEREMAKRRLEGEEKIPQ